MLVGVVVGVVVAVAGAVTAVGILQTATPSSIAAALLPLLLAPFATYQRGRTRPITIHRQLVREYSILFRCRFKTAYPAPEP